jgi:Na+-driven multidrug efflux pump
MPQTAPVAQAKTLRFLAMNMVVAGLIVGIGMPVLFTVLDIQVEMTPWGFDVIWLIFLAIMIFDFVLARVFWRRAMALEQGKAGPAR